MEKATYTFMPWSSGCFAQGHRHQQLPILHHRAHQSILGPSTTPVVVGTVHGVHDLPEGGMLFPLFRYHDSPFVPALSAISGFSSIKKPQPSSQLFGRKKGDIIVRMSGDERDRKLHHVLIGHVAQNPILIISYFTTLIIISWHHLIYRPSRCPS